MIESVQLVTVALAGLCVGSFLNVVIWRLPRGENLARPRSRCPGCGTMIAWYDNIPLLSWLLLRARCRRCKTPIALRYPLVELVTAALYVVAWRQWPDHAFTAILVGTYLAALLALSAIDWEHKILPDAITIPGTVLAVLLAPLTRLHPSAWISGLGPWPNAWLHALAGAFVGALIILLIRWIGGWIAGKEAMGLGDVKLLAMIGALVGPAGTLYALVLASLVGSVVGILRLLWARRRPLPFPLAVTPKGEAPLSFTSARIVGDRIVPTPASPTDPPPPEGKATVAMTLPAAGILEDDDAAVTVRGVVEHVGDAWHVRVTKASDEDRERLDLYAASLKYVPFGPFLAIGGAAMLLAGDGVRWLVTEGWPAFVQRLFA